MKFIKNWSKETTTTGEIIYRPMLCLYIQEKYTLGRYYFIVDGGADISLAPRYVANKIGLDWQSGKKVMMRGISRSKPCEVEGRVHKVEVIVPDIKLKIQIPICFAIGDAPLLLGREGFFDYFIVTYDKKNKRTFFEQY
ncbi:MAG: hypothetical protein ACE5KT_04340 [Methanosarcinales archaeon]